LATKRQALHKSDQTGFRRIATAPQPFCATSAIPLKGLYLAEILTQAALP